MRELFESNRLIDNSYVGILFNDVDVGKYGNYWLHSFRSIPMLNDLRSRSLPFVTPWLNNEHPKYMRLPNMRHYRPGFEVTTKTLEEILDRRAVELHQIAVEDNKKIWIMWSGGIDSTTMLAAFIRNVDQKELSQRYSIVMSANSVAENYYFFKHFVDGKFNLINWLDLDMSEDLLKDTIVLHGDPANALLSCPTVSVFAPLVESKKHLLPFRDNLDIIVNTLETFIAKTGKQKLDGWAEWYIHKLANAIPDTDKANSIAAFWWWNYVNFKWHGSILRPFFFTRTSTDKKISEEEFKYYYNTCFYISDDLQNWSYSNIDKIIETPFDYKPQMRDYIYSLSKDELYTKYKGFKASRRTNLNQALLDSNMPFIYDKDWVGHSLNDELKDTLLGLLHEYEG